MGLCPSQTAAEDTVQPHAHFADSKPLADNEAQSQTATARAKLQLAIQHADELTEEAVGAVSALSKMDLHEMKALKQLPASLSATLVAMGVALGVEDGEAAVHTRGSSQRPAISTMMTLEKLDTMHRLMSLDTVPLDERKLALLQAHVNNPANEPSVVRKTSLAGGAFAVWLRAVVARAELQRLVQSEGCLAADGGATSTTGDMPESTADSLLNTGSGLLCKGGVVAIHLVREEMEQNGLGEYTATASDVAANAHRLRDKLLAWGNSPATWGAAEGRLPLPGQGRIVRGAEPVMHELAGHLVPAVEPTVEPEPGWADSLEQSLRRYGVRQIAPELSDDAVWEEESGDRLRDMLRLIKTVRSACGLLLTHWPRGDGLGELLLEPDIDDTPASRRGVSAAYWLAVCQRAAFVPTRIIVEVFVKPVTQAASCALWFYVPRQYRCDPDVFLSHSWDGSAWDLRPPLGSSMWLDLFAITQHPRKAEAGEESVADDVLAMYPDVAHVRTVLESVAATVVILPAHARDTLLPLERSWCVFEMIFTPPECLRMQLGWTKWTKEEHVRYRELIDTIDISRAQTSSSEDKRKIDGFVLERFGSMSEANTFLRKLAREGFLKAVEECYACGQAEIRGETGSADMFSARGVTPLFDEAIVDIYRADPL